MSPVAPDPADIRSLSASPGEGPVVPDPGGEPRRYKFILLGEIDDFGALRRHIGLPLAQSLAHDVARRIKDSLPTLRVAAIGRTTIEMAFDGDDGGDGRAMAARVREVMAAPFDLGDGTQTVRMIVGGCGVRGPDIDDVQLVEVAEQVLVDARARGIDIVHDLADPLAAHDPIMLIRELPAAIEAGQIFLTYQPKVHVRRQEVASAEALVRWRHPRRGLILPGNFIEAAERYSAIGLLTLWTIRRVIADQRALAAVGHDFPIFINISGVLLSDHGFVREACALIADGGRHLGFEITETAVIRDPESAIANLLSFADIGVALAIDDYGAGLSSLAYLKRLPARELKIDKLFVTQLTSSHRDPLIVRSTIDLAHALGMEVTAEGVETAASLALLSVMGCDMVQGYLISRPIEFDAFRRFLDDNRHVDAMVSSRLSFRRNQGLWQAG